MAEAKDKWDEVGERFGDLGRHLKDRFDANAAFGAAERERVNNALRELGDALDAGFTTIGEALRDPSMREEMKSAGSSIADAITATLRDVSDAIKRHRATWRRSSDWSRSNRSPA